MHDGAPGHFSRAVRYVLNNTHHDRWIGRGGSTAWPPRSADLNPLDFWVWGHLKPPCIHLLLAMMRYFALALWMPAKTIRNYPGIFKQMQQSMMRRIEACIEFHGRHFEHLYKCNLSVICHKLNVSRHMLERHYSLNWYVQLVLNICPNTLVTSRIFYFKLQFVEKQFWGQFFLLLLCCIRVLISYIFE
jgi:hypothetical protein